MIPSILGPNLKQPQYEQLTRFQGPISCQRTLIYKFEITRDIIKKNNK